MENVNRCPKDIDLGIKIYFRNFLWKKEKKKNFDNFLYFPLK